MDLRLLQRFRAALDARHLPSTQTAAYVGWEAATGTIIVSFRGTVTPLEWLEDFDLTLVPLPASLNASCPACLVAQGFFYLAYYGLRGQMHAAIARMPSPAAPIALTGHSLGAILAEYAAFELANVVSCTTFGTPRGGNAAWAAAWAAAAPPTAFRVVHAADPVPHLPPLIFDYVHAPCVVFLPHLRASAPPLHLTPRLCASPPQARGLVRQK